MSTNNQMLDLYVGILQKGYRQFDDAASEYASTYISATGEQRSTVDTIIKFMYLHFS